MRKSRQNGRTILILVNKYSHQACGVYVEKETFNTYRQHTGYFLVISIVYLVRRNPINLKCFGVFFFPSVAHVISWVKALFLPLDFCTFCSFPFACRRNAHNWYGQCGLVGHLYCYCIPPSPKCKRNLTFNTIPLTHTVSDTAQAYSYPLQAVYRLLRRVNRCTETSLSRVKYVH